VNKTRTPVAKAKRRSHSSTRITDRSMISGEKEASSSVRSDFDAFLAWCEESGIDVRVKDVEFAARSASLDGGSTLSPNANRGVIASTSAPAGESLATIPFRMCLTASSCGRRDVMDAIQTRLEKCKLEASWLCSVSSALCVERTLGDASKWGPYLKILPKQEPNVVSLWSDDERQYLAGTEVEMSLRDELSAAKREWEEVASPCFEENGIQCTFEDYHAARTIVSSRAFTVSPSAGVGLVPIADAFNHRTGGHDVNIGDGATSANDMEDSLCVKITKSEGVKAGDEIFNTYGFLGNAKLLNSYGFTQEDNPADKVSINTANIRAAAALSGIVGAQIAKRFTWIESSELCAPDASFEIGVDIELPIDMLSVIWACVTAEELFNKIRHTTRREDALTAIGTVARGMSEKKQTSDALMTDPVADVIRRAVERRLTLYVEAPTHASERLISVSRLIVSERRILNAVLDKLECQSREISNKRAKSTDAFDLFD
jgi:SET domain-containing protein 6